MAALVWAAAALAAALGAGALGAPPLAGAGIAAAILAADLGSQGRLALSRAGAQEVALGRGPRAENVVAGLAGTLELGRVRLLSFPSLEPRAFVCHARGLAVVFSAGLLESYSRTELEAVVAHCLLRARSHNVRLSELACHLRWLGGSVGLVVGAHEDVAAAAITRYPPALAAAIGKSVPARGHLAPLYFAALHPCHEAPEARLASLSDL